MAVAWKVELTKLVAVWLLFERNDVEFLASKSDILSEDLRSFSM
jgi:hypothetical protein